MRAMMDTPHLGEAGVHPVIASSARELLNKSENKRSGVLSTAMSFLGLYRDPVVARVTARCDWRIADLVGGKKAVSPTLWCRRVAMVDICDIAGVAAIELIRREQVSASCRSKPSTWSIPTRSPVRTWRVSGPTCSAVRSTTAATIPPASSEHGQLHAEVDGV
ncbi:hypothetical protein ABID19_000128 [Mesorhizobium robiniae]|uniref:Uncharacterized protein n=1 Tax=Mesorhizobium robiniae TaxID=559315 RepID=A0ABV2GFS6_9HYPH